MRRRAQIAVAGFVLAVLAFLGVWLYRVFFPGPAPTERPELRVHGPRAPRVVVLNVSGMPPVGRKARQILQKLGYRVRLLSFPGETLATSVILIHRAELPGLPRKLQQALQVPIAAPDPDPENPADATVVLGRDALTRILVP